MSTPGSSWSPDAVLAHAAAMEEKSEHPLAEAITRTAKAQNLALPRVDDFQAVPGLGVEAKIDGQAVLLGNLAFLAGQGVVSEELADHQDRLSREGKTAIFLAVGGLPVGVIAAADTLKPRAAQTVAVLKAMGLKILLSSGDNRQTAAAVAKSIGHRKTYWRRCCPATRPRKWRNSRLRVKWWPWWETASTTPRPWPRRTWASPWAPGADVALEAADLTLIRDDLGLIPAAIKLARQMQCASSARTSSGPSATTSWPSP